MAKNPFKKQSIIDTAVNVAVGGAANVAIDYVVSQVDFIQEMGDTTINAGKIVLGAVLGSMVSDKTLRAACDGVATVGISNLIAGFMAGQTGGAASDGAEEPTSGLPYGTIGRVRLGNKAYRRSARRVSGVNSSAVMGK